MLPFLPYHLLYLIGEQIIVVFNILFVYSQRTCQRTYAFLHFCAVEHIPATTQKTFYCLYYSSAVLNNILYGLFPITRFTVKYLVIPFEIS